MKQLIPYVLAYKQYDPVKYERRGGGRSEDIQEALIVSKTGKLGQMFKNSSRVEFIPVKIEKIA